MEGSASVKFSSSPSIKGKCKHKVMKNIRIMNTPRRSFME